MTLGITRKRVAAGLMLAFLMWLNFAFLVQPGGLAFLLFTDSHVEPMNLSDEKIARKPSGRNARGRGKNRRRRNSGGSDLSDGPGIDEAGENFDLAWWSSVDYDYEKDPASGLEDSLQPVNETIDTRRGDCEDYAAVVTSYFWGQGEDVEVHLMWNPSNFIMHIGVEHDGDFYDSNDGVTHDTTAQEWASDNGYIHLYERTAEAPN